MNLFRKTDTTVKHAYIITVKGNENSERLSQRAQESCRSVGMNFKVWDAYDGTKPGDIVPPKHLENDSIMNILKITDHYLTRGEVACALSHISLWAHCALIDEPIVILEHDAVMIKKFEVLENFNSICYLGGQEWAVDKWPIQKIPPFASEGPNKYFICRAHAYCIDPAVAKNLLSHVIRQGICDPLDIMIRADLFNISSQGLFATDLPDATTINARPTHGRTTDRNDKLEW